VSFFLSNHYFLIREKREVDFTNAVESIVRRGGSCLIPVFALGRAQELLLILDEYWRNNAELQVG
jgi:cleavage and polyadenylation specificity factor subunit 3